MNALSYLKHLEYDISKEDSVPAQNVAEFIRRIQFRIYRHSVINETKLLRLREFLITHGVMGEHTERKISRISNWINSQV